MAKLAFGIVGAVIGGIASGGLGWAIGLGFMGGSLLGNTLFPTTIKTTVEGERLSNLQISAATWGNPIPKVFGTIRLAGNIIWAQNLVETRHEQSQRSGGGGGKGMGGGATVTSVWYTYAVDVAVAICEGPIDSIRRIWADTKVIYDASGASGGVVEAQPGVIKIYRGSEDQLPDPTIQAREGTDNTPACLGLAYVVFTGLQLADYANRIPAFSFEVCKAHPPYVPPTLLAAVEARPWGGGYKVPGQPWLVGFDRSEPTITPTLWRYDLTFKTLVQQVIYDHAIDNPLLVADSNYLYFSEVVAASGAMSLVKAQASTLAVVTAVEVPKASAGAIGNGYLVTNDPAVSLYDSSLGLVGALSGVFGTNNLALAIRVPAGSSTKPFKIPGNWPSFATVPWDSRTVKNTANPAWVPLYGPPNPDTGEVPIVGYNGPSLEVWACDGTTLKSSSTDSGLNVFDQLGGQLPAVLVVDSVSGQLIMASGRDHKVHWYRLGDLGSGSTAVFKQTLDGVLGIPPTRGWMAQSIEVKSDQLWLVYGSQASCLQVSTSTVIEVLDLTPWLMVAGGPTYSNPTAGVWDPESYVFALDCDQGTLAIAHGCVGVNPTTAGEIAQEILHGVGLAPELLDTSAIDRIAVDGYAVTSATSARSALEPILGAFQIDVAETGGRLRFTPRGSAPVLTIPEGQLGAFEIAAGSSTQPPNAPAQLGQSSLEAVSNPRLSETRTADSELPAAVTVTYADPNRDNQQNTQRAQRLSATMGSKDPEAQDYSAVVMDADTAATIAARQLYAKWAERRAFSFTLPVAYLALDPGDVVTLQRNGAALEVRLTQIQLGGNYLLHCQAVSTEAEVYQRTATGCSPPLYANRVPYTGNATLVPLDLPMLRVDDNLSGVYFTFGTANAGWPGGVCYVSTDGSNFTQAMGVGRSASYGDATSVLGPPLSDPWGWDWDNSVDLMMVNGALASASALDVLNGGNIGLLGAEIIQWQLATPGSVTGQYTLSGLLRGRRGTEDACGSHVKGEYFALLEQNAYGHAAVPASSLAKPVWYIGPTYGNQTNSVTPIQQVYRGRVLQPFAPVHLRGVRDEAGNLALSWVRRARWYGEWTDLVDVPLFEESEAYQVEVLDSTGVVKRTLACSSPAVEYDAASQVADFGSVKESISIAVYQISTIVGRGIAARATL